MLFGNHDRYDHLTLRIPTRMGVINSLEKFDAEFFSVPPKFCDIMDPRLRKLLEVCHEAVVDAGVVPKSIQGSRTGVFVGVTDSDAGAITKRTRKRTNLYGVLGNESSMLANRVSYTMDLNGPSLSVHTACSSGFTAVHQAILAIRAGLCDAAIVAGAQCNHDAVTSFMFHGLEMTSTDGKCRSFDAGADGFVRAEAVVAIYICKMHEAKRAYATLIHAAINNDGYKEEGISFPSRVQQENVIRQVYDETGIDPLEVDYVEAHGTGTLVGDPQEMHAIMKVFCAGRSQPLLVGSVKSNMGHSEPVSGLCGLSKMVLSHTKGILPANLHYNTPNPDIPALVDRRIRVVDKNQQFKAKYVGLNSMGFGGTNVHILLKFNNHETAPPWVPSIPVILLCSGRSNQAVTHFLDQALLDSKNQHFVKLLHELSKEAMPRHPFRGYVVIHSESMGINVHNTDPKESVWFIFTGMGSQWVGMFTNLIKFDAFNKSVDLSHNYLENINYNLRHVLKSAEPTILDAFKNAMVTINVFQEKKRETFLVLQMHTAVCTCSRSLT
ncbi:unnamed protein product [Allacma fusca]|uniref:Fatty acid synthase n=1 Tax=Allacma fusca TaxID=39272 RepID=A0A8J2L3X3_9HEXA|nr:unnamed protein product [Allacma fusca]